MLKKLITTILMLSLLLSVTSFGYCSTEKNNTVKENTVTLLGVPDDVSFGNETIAKGNYEIEGLTVSSAVSVISIAIGISGIAAYLTVGVNTAISVGASHIYWTKKIAYGEDDEYYYVRTKIRLYTDYERENPVTEWKTVYQKKSKASGASLEVSNYDF